MLLAVLAALIVVAGLRLMYHFPGAPAEDRQSAVAVSTALPGMNKLRVRMWVDSSVVRPDEAAHMTVRFENGTGETISGLAIVDAQEPGFWYQPLELKAWSLAPGESVESAPVELRPSTGRGRYRVTVRYRVKGADDLVREGAIASPPILIRNEEAERRDRFLRRMLSVFTLPLLLELIGFWLQRQQAVEARRQEIWKTILPHFYSLSERHYLPIVRSLRAVERTRVADGRRHRRSRCGGCSSSFCFFCCAWIFSASGVGSSSSRAEGASRWPQRRG
ncbi:hypothetical protein [Edaphobacter aggregans]|uniref:hypothetical protein n=1 Tax=Edaphobacter aggregans TaxID=570835 RepID=UPI00068ABCB8|nr:hypothetical protein [Edaphobacter aggregans]